MASGYHHKTIVYQGFGEVSGCGFAASKRVKNRQYCRGVLGLGIHGGFGTNHLGW